MVGCGEYSCSIGKGIGKLPLRATISLGKKILNCPREQPCSSRSKCV